MEYQTDDNPLSICDSDNEVLLADCGVPAYFPEDLLSLVEEARRPTYRYGGSTVRTLSKKDMAALARCERAISTGFVGPHPLRESVQD